MADRGNVIAGLLAALVLALGIAAPAGAAGWTPYDRPAQYGTVTDKDVPITMRDGTVLRADVQRPDAPGRFPVLVTQTPYGKSAGAAALGAGASYLVARGYVQVTVDVRGTGSSQGQWDSFGEAEQRDGYDVVEWAASQTWSDGKVGTVGPSYMGLNQLYTAALRPPHLKAIFPIVPMADGYRDITLSGGSVNSGFIPLWLGLVTGASLVPAQYAASGNPDDVVSATTTLASHAAGIAGFQTSTLLGATTGGDLAYDGPFWKTRSPLEVVDRIQVPAFVVGGLHDIFQRGEPLVYERLKGRVPTRLLIGPWTHVAGSMGEGLPRDGVPSFAQIQLRWFDHWLKGIDTKVSSIPKVTQYTWGLERYETQADWPNPKLQPLPMYLRGGGALSPQAPRTAEPSQSFLQHPLTGICTQSTAQWTAGLGAAIPCTRDNSLDERLGQAVYTTAPLSQDLRMNGPIMASLWITSTAADAPITVRVTTVDASGASTELTDGWLAASFRATDPEKGRVVRGQELQPWHPYTRASAQPLEAGRPARLDVEVFPTNAVIRKGQRLRVVVAPGDFPHQAPPLPMALSSLGGQVQVLTDPDHKSYVALPTAGETCAVGKARSPKCRALPVPDLVR